MFLKKSVFSALGGIILAFGLCHIHAYSGVTEGGALGLTLLFFNWWALSPALSGFVMNTICYAVGIRTFGKEFLLLSAIAGGAFSASYAVFDCFEPFFPQLPSHPLLAAVLGALFVGIGVGLCIREGGAPTGDDALAMSLSEIMKLDIRWVYLIFDVVVLSLSLTYIPFGKIVYSLITVVFSGQLVGLISKIPHKTKKPQKSD